MDPRKTLEERFQNSGISYGSVKIEPLESVPLLYKNEGRGQKLTEAIEYINRNNGINLNAIIGKKGRIVNKFMGFIVTPLIAKQNNLDTRFTVAFNELARLNQQKAELYNRISELEAKLVSLESKL